MVIALKLQRPIITFSFEQLGLSKMIAQHLTSNPASGEVMKKTGMVHIKKTQIYDRDGNRAEIETYEITNI